MNLTIYDYVKFAESSYSNDIKKVCRLGFNLTELIEKEENKVA